MTFEELAIGDKFKVLNRGDPTAIWMKINKFDNYHAILISYLGGSFHGDLLYNTLSASVANNDTLVIRIYDV